MCACVCQCVQQHLLVCSGTPKWQQMSFAFQCWSCGGNMCLCLLMQTSVIVRNTQWESGKCSCRPAAVEHDSNMERWDAAGLTLELQGKTGSLKWCWAGGVQWDYRSSFTETSQRDWIKTVKLWRKIKTASWRCWNTPQSWGQLQSWW